MTQSEFEHIAPLLRGRMLKVALDFFGNQDDAEDVTQEAMVQLWRYCEQIESSRGIEHLAVRVAKNCCVNLYRKRQAAANLLPLTSCHSPLHQDPSGSPQELLEAEDAQRMMDEVIALLKPRERQLFMMRHTQGLSTKEISEQTDIPKASVAVMISVARKKVYTELTKRLKQ